MAEIVSHFWDASGEASFFFFFCSEEGLECSFGRRFEGRILERPIWLMCGAAVDQLHGDDVCGDDFAQDIHGDWNEFTVLELDEASVVIENFVGIGECVGDCAEVFLRGFASEVADYAAVE